MTVYVFRELPTATEQSSSLPPVSSMSQILSTLLCTASLACLVLYITHLHIFHIIQGVRQKNKQTQTKKGNCHVGRKNISRGQIGKIQKRREPAGENKDNTRHRRREGVIKNQWT